MTLRRSWFFISSYMDDPYITAFFTRAAVNVNKIVTPSSHIAFAFTHVPSLESLACPLAASLPNKNADDALTSFELVYWDSLAWYIRGGVKRILCGGRLVSHAWNWKKISSDSWVIFGNRSLSMDVFLWFPMFQWCVVGYVPSRYHFVAELSE